VTRLEIATLGPPEVRLDGQPVAGLATSKVRALLYYLAVESGRPHRRESLAGLLWPDYPERSARHNLSNALSNLRVVLGDHDAAFPYFDVSHEAIAFNAQSDCWVDATAFSTLVERGGWEKGAALYRGPFLEGFSLPDSPPFEQWTLVIRERLQRGMMAALEGWADECEERGDHPRAIEVARRQLVIEPWHEGAHRALMRVLALSDKRASALAQYEVCRRVLEQELDVAPSAETTELYERIRSGAIASREGTPARQPDETAPAALTAEMGPAPASPVLAAPAPAPLAGERRWVTVLHVEVDQAAALLDEVGPEAWGQLMARALDVIADEVQRYGGGVLERRQEGAIAIFGVPAAHEDDAERAVLAALRIRERVGDGPKLRIGVDAGEVLVTVVSDRPQVIGRALTLARRANVAAGAGTVSVGENAHRLVQRLFEWDTADVAAGMRRPLRRVAEVGKGRGIAGLSSPLVGRDEELHALQGAVDRLQAGIGGIVTVVGEAGIGKSRLVAEIRKHNLAKAKHPSQGLPTQWVEGRCQSYGGSIAYSLWLDMLHGVLDVPHDAAAAIVGDALRARVKALCPDYFDEVHPYLCRLLSLPLEERYASLRDLQGESLRAEIFSALQTLVKSAARQRPLAMVCEDLHWADTTSLALLERVFALTDHEALLMICVLRPEVKHGCWQLRETTARRYRHRYTDLWLDALTPDESWALVGHLLQIEDLAETLRSKILDHAEGNPFYVEEILRALIDEGTITYDNATERWCATRDIAAIPLPDTLHGVLSARIDRLEGETRRVLRLASVIGRTFPYRVLAEITGGGSPLPAGEGVGVRALDAHLLALQRQQLIRERARLPEVEYIFHHELTREAAYDGLLVQERRTFHRQIAETVERLFPEQVDEQAGLLAYHWERAGDTDRAIEYLLKAAESSRQTYANQEAVAHLQRALTLLEGADTAQHTRWRMQALWGMGIVLLNTGKVNEAEAPLREAIALGNEIGLDAHALARLHYWLADSLWWQNRYDETIQTVEEGLALLGGDTESTEAAMLTAPLAASYGRKGRPDKADETSLRTAQYIQRLPYSAELRPAYNVIVDAYLSRRSVEEAKQWNQVAMDKARSCHDLYGVAGPALEFAEISVHTGDLAGALSHHQQALETFVRIGDRKHEGWVTQGLANTALALGDLEAAERIAYQQLALARAVDTQLDMASAYLLIGLVQLAKRDWEAAGKALVEAKRISQQIDSPWGTRVNYYLGCLAMAQGNNGDAVSEFRQSIAPCGARWFASLRSVPRLLASRLGPLEAAYQDAAAFRAFCRRYREEDPEIRQSSLAQWWLEPAEVVDLSGPEDLTGLDAPGWTWHDPFGDCAYTLDYGPVIRAANGRDMWHLNWSAPRLLREVSGDFGAQTACMPAVEDRPTIGGLLLWKDKENYLHLDRGVFGAREITLIGCVENADVVIGRGWLYEASERILLRMERTGDRVRAYCSADGEHWYRVGQATFPVSDPVQIGVHAAGNIERAIYPGAYPNGTAIRFESFQLWQGGD
jgi:DNA-binding SARP family transcriptional activator/tetratricopeptide (TPR) repeat protein/regulation of enolase protein 1 (concanavalin A-like superfamily)